MKISALIRVHGDPEGAFLHFFDDEVGRVKDVSVVMRERSVSVCLLRHLLEPYKGMWGRKEKGKEMGKERILIISLLGLCQDMCRSIHEFGMSLNSKKIRLMSMFAEKTPETSNQKYDRFFFLNPF